MPIYTYIHSTGGSFAHTVGPLMPVLVDPTVRQLEWLEEKARRLRSRSADLTGIIVRKHVFVTLGLVDITNLLQAVTGMPPERAEESLKQYVYFGIGFTSGPAYTHSLYPTLIFYNSPRDPEARRKIMEHEIIRRFRKVTIGMDAPAQWWI